MCDQVIDLIVCFAGSCLKNEVHSSGQDGQLAADNRLQVKSAHAWIPRLACFGAEKMETVAQMRVHACRS